jgi:hypothetical protein
MADRLLRVWRLVRRPTPAPAFALGHRARPVGDAGNGGDTRVCNASGWHMRAGCNDGDGGTICPLCSRRVGIARQATTPHGIEVIEAHCA